MSRIYNLISGYINLIRNWNLHRDRNIWIFGEWFGEKCCDNCLYLANELCESHSELKLYWITEDNTDTTALSSKIIVVQRDSEECKRLLHKAGVAIMNQEYLDFSKSGQNYFGGATTVNLWHGVMWKKIGFDLRNRHDLISKIYHKLERKIETADYWLATSVETKKLFEHAYCLGKNQIIKAGYPRNSIFYDKEKTSIAKNKVIKQVQSLSEYKLKALPSVIITYMPTFRDKTNECFSFINNKSQKLERLLEKNNAIIIEKSHFVTENRKKDKRIRNTSGRIFGINDVQATELLAATDILITDYSSCFFDFLLLNRPIIHYIYDYNYYVNNDRGVYYTKEQIACGKTPETIDEVISSIEAYIKDPSIDENLRKRQRDRFWEYDSSDACEKIYQAIRKIQEKQKV